MSYLTNQIPGLEQLSSFFLATSPDTGRCGKLKDSIILS
jgi:hypothetical protein